MKGVAFGVDWHIALVAALALVLLGAIGAWVVLRIPTRRPGAQSSSSSS